MKKRILGAFLALALALTLFPASVPAEAADIADEIQFCGFESFYALQVYGTARKNCSLLVGLYDRSGKMKASAVQAVAPNSRGWWSAQLAPADFSAEDEFDEHETYAKACLLDADTLAPLCAPADTLFHPEQYALIERISIETVANGVATRTASALGNVETQVNGNVENDEALQVAYNQSKSPLGASDWNAQAQLRFSDGTRRTVTLDDSRNYRTSAASDAYYTFDGVAGQITDNTRIPARFISADPTDPGDYGTIAGNNDSGEGDGNWIAEPFTAGHIVHFKATRNADGYNIYTLKSINDDRIVTVYDFVLKNRQIWTSDANGSLITITSNGRTVRADFETHFVVENIADGSYKTYVGVKNAPEIDRNESVPAIAHIYYIDGVAKLAFVYNASNVTEPVDTPSAEPSDDIVFLAAPTLSQLFTTSEGRYYEIAAVEKNEIKTLAIKANAGVSFEANDVIFTPGASGQDKAYNCVILNSVTYDSKDFMTRGAFVAAPDGDNAFMAHGVRRMNSEEIRLNTSIGKASMVKDVSENVRVFFVDGGKIERIGYDDIVNDTLDYVYYVENSDGEVTYLFIVNYEPENDIPTASIPAGSRYVNVGAASYYITPNKTTVTAGERFTFTVSDMTDPDNPVDVTDELTDVWVGYVFVGANGEDPMHWVQAAYNPDNNRFSAAIPDLDIDDELVNGSDIVFDIVP